MREATNWNTITGLPGADKTAPDVEISEMSDRLYADNAATSFPKPPCVWEAMQSYATELGASAGRGAYREAIETGELLNACRRRLAGLLHVREPNQIVFTQNCSAALNQAIKGLLRPGDHVIATAMEHNSVLRPLNALAERGEVSVDFIGVDPESTIVNPADIFNAVRSNTRLICTVHASNVTGAIQPIAAIGAEARRRGLLFLVDAAQTAGHVPIDVNAMFIDLLALPGHKGLMGPLGTGALFMRPSLENVLTPLIHGGTGSVSELAVQPDFMPDRFESGSHNAIGIAGLNAALVWLGDQTVEACREHDLELSREFMVATREATGLRVYGPVDSADRVAVFSVAMEGLDPAELAAVLESEFGILTRPGIHCAPFAHRTIGTESSGGTTRLSFGMYNTQQDVRRCAEALTRLASAGSLA